jgi:pimeloyl-ACP methyl ester carboxylesterase
VTPVGSLDHWWSEGRILSVSLASGTYDIQVRISGAGPWLTLLHGFPASSYEWAAVSCRLEQRHRVLAFDFLGYGRSAKPPGHRYSVFEQADLVATHWDKLEVEETSVVAYDYGAIVGQELLARRQEGQLGVAVARLLLLNAGIYAELYRPRLAQRLSIAPPLTGSLMSALFNERLFTRAWSEVFSDEHPLDPATGHEHYRALRYGDAARDVQRWLLAYIPERAAHRQRFEAALANTDVPLHFLWGLQDPVSGRLIAEALRDRMPNVDLVEYLDAGHCPHLEIPDRVASDIDIRTTRSGSETERSSV